MCVQLLLNGFINNSIIPIQSKLAIMYDISETLVNLPIILSFLVFSIVNFPANVFIDWKGLRWSFIIGSILYATGVGFYCFINYSYGMMIIGTIIFSLGQPFIINCPAKIAAFWFFPQNVHKISFSEHLLQPLWWVSIL